MSEDAELVGKLRANAAACASPKRPADRSLDDETLFEASINQSEAADRIEALTRERDEALLKHSMVDAVLARVGGELGAAMDRAEAAVAMNPLPDIERRLSEARNAVLEEIAKIADEHRARVPNHDPEAQSADLVAQGYGNAAFNIAAAIRALQARP